MSARAVKALEAFCVAMETNLHGDHEEPHVWSRATGGIVSVCAADLRAVLSSLADAEREARQAVRELTRDHHRTCVCVWCAPRKARAKTGEPCPGSGTDYATQAGWEGGSERCSSCGADVRVRDNGKLATHRPPRAKTGRRGK